MKCAVGVGMNVDTTALVSQLLLGCELETGDDKNLCGCFADRTAADVISNLRPSDWVHHWCHWLRRRQPVAVVIARRERTTIIDVAEHKRHRVEHAQTATWTPCTFPHPPALYWIKGTDKGCLTSYSCGVGALISLL